MTRQDRRTSPWTSLVVAATGLAGFVPSDGAVDVVRALVVLALWAPAAGWASSATRTGWLVPGFWLAALELAAHATDLDRLRAGAALAGLFLLGRGLASWLPFERRSGAVVVLLLAAGLALLPGLAGALADPWPANVAARLLDLSPVVLVGESAGIDWMRRPGVYAAVGCDRFARASFATSWAAGSILALGTLVALSASLRGRGTAEPAD